MREVGTDPLHAHRCLGQLERGARRGGEIVWSHPPKLGVGGCAGVVAAPRHPAPEALGAWESAASRPSIPATPVLRLPTKPGREREEKKRKGKSERTQGEGGESGEGPGPELTGCRPAARPSPIPAAAALREAPLGDPALASLPLAVLSPPPFPGSCSPLPLPGRCW